MPMWQHLGWHLRGVLLKVGIRRPSLWVMNQTVAKSDSSMEGGMDHAVIRQPAPRAALALVRAWAYSESAVGRGRSTGSCVIGVVEGRGVLRAA